MIFRIRYQATAGGHVHCRLFVAPGRNRTFASSGEFTLRLAEFNALRQAFSAAEFLDDDQPEISSRVLDRAG